MRSSVLVGSSVLGVSLAVAVFVGCAGGDSGSGTDEPAGDAGTTAVDASSSSSGGDASASAFSISATVVGLQGSGLVLHEKGGADLAVTPQGAGSQKVTFPAKYAAGTAFEVTVKAQPTSPPQTCAVMGGSGKVVSGDVESITVNCTTLYTVGGTVSGLAGKDLILDNAGDAVTINQNGAFAFPKPLATSTPWSVTVKQNPTNKWQTCKATVGDAGSAAGLITNANVTNVAVTCTTNAYKVSVKVTGLAGSGLVLEDNGGDDLVVAADGTLPFATAIDSGAGYDVTVKTQPTSPWQTCTVASGKATMAGADVVVNVTCTTNKYKVGGTLSGLQGNGLVLQNNAGDDLTLNAAANGAFSFLTSVNSGAPYAVTIKTQPTGVAGESCSVANGSGTVAGADVTSVLVSCAAALASLNGTDTTNMSTPHSSFHDTTTEDPVTGKVYVFPTYNAVTTVYEYPTLADFKANTNARTITLQTPYDGTYHVVLNGYIYYAATNSNTLVRALATDGTTATTTTLAGAGFRNQSCFNWGGFSDIDFYVDAGNVLYVLYAASGGGNMQIRTVDPATLALGAPVTFARVKTNTGWGFVRRGVFYYGTTYNSPTFGGGFKISDGSAVTVTNSFTPVPSDYITSVSWDPTSKNLFENTVGRTVVYPNVN